MAIEAKYDPDAAARLFTRMQTRFQEPVRRPQGSPAAEVGQAMANALGDYFRSHPPSQVRVRELNAMVERHRTELAGQSFYIGKRNFAERKPRSEVQYIGEFVIRPRSS
jgi:hypothetical protein